MAKAKKSVKSTRGVKKTSTSHEMIDTKTEHLMSSTSGVGMGMPTRMGVNIKLVIGLIVVVLAGILVTNKGLLVAAVVNGRPIFRWDLNKALVSRFGQQTLESMVSEQLIAEAAQKSNVTITQKDVDAKVKEITQSLGPNVKMEDLLKYQGMTKGDFEGQIKLQLTIEKILSSDINITEGDIDNYIATNAATLTATDETAMRKEAKEALKTQLVSEKLQPWFMELKSKANIINFLK